MPRVRAQGRAGAAGRLPPRRSGHSPSATLPLTLPSAIAWGRVLVALLGLLPADGDACVAGLLMVVGGILGAISFNPFVILQGFFLGAPLAADPLPACWRR